MRQALLLNYLRKIALCSLLTLHYLVGWGMYQSWNNSSQDDDGASEVVFFLSPDSEDVKHIPSLLLLEEDKEEEVEDKIKTPNFNIPSFFFSLKKTIPSFICQLPSLENQAWFYPEIPRWLILRKLIV